MYLIAYSVLHSTGVGEEREPAVDEQQLDPATIVWCSFLLD
jgi:hypothetical protein